MSAEHPSSSFTVFSGSKPELIDNIGTVSHQKQKMRLVSQRHKMINLLS